MCIKCHLLITFCIVIEIYTDFLAVCLGRGPVLNCFRTEWRNTVKSHKTIFICRDFSVDLLNPNNHNIINDFINAVYSMKLYRAINRPTGITPHCATLTDNIIRNYILNKMISGVLLSDICLCS